MDFTPEKILLIQFRQIGDVLLSAPAAEVLKANFPCAKLDFLTQAPADQALARNPAIDEILVYDAAKPLKWLLEARRRGYDLVIDLMSNPRSALVTALSGAAIKAGPAYTYSSWAYNFKLRLRAGQREYNPFFKIDLLSQLGLKNLFYPYPKVYPAAADLDWAAAAAAELLRAGRTGPAETAGKRPVIAFSPASRRKTRLWPAEHYARLASLIAQNTKAAVLVLWGPGERPLAEGIVRAAGRPAVILAPETPTLSRLSALLRQTALLVSNCNGAKHIAQASGVPTLGIYGSSRPESWTPPGDPKHQVIRNEQLPCLACQKNECPDDRALGCLRELSPGSVFAKLILMAGELGLGI
ncbi:MAG: glycosyltransferase family 9 protein [Elusimicrobiales bacterium]|jgi:ADP-heptose:LPS heptosyltransferase